MKSSADQIIDFKEISVPKEKLTIEIPSWNAVAQPLVDFAMKQYQDQTGRVVNELQDEHVEQLDLPVNTVQELTQYGMEVYHQSQTQYQFYNEVLPFILNYYYKHTQTNINEDEQQGYINDYMQQVQAYADQANLSLDEYGKQKMNIEGDVEAEFHKRAKEDFVFKIIAQQVFEERGGKLDEEAYEIFIQQNVLQSQADEIEMREHFPYDAFVKMMPEMRLSQDIYDYYLPQIKFEVNPEAPLQFRE